MKGYTMYWFPALLLAALATSAHAQATAQTSVAPDLRECYTDSWLLNRNNLPPTTIQTLIDIIRHIEDHPDVNVDLRTMATLLLHTYRQDGIQYHSREGIAMSANVLPFSPTFYTFHRHRLLLRIIPSNLQALPNNTISSPLKCVLHHMLSTTVDARVRGDENTCGQLSQYRALRTSRSARSVDDDVEILDLSKLEGRNGQLRQHNPNDDVESTGSYGPKIARQLMGESACPILTGVVNSKWGAVSAGTLIAGIAAGAESQQIPLSELTRDSVLNYQNVQPTVTSIFPATMAGDLAEAVLIQGTRGSQSISIGAAGNWNSSQATRYFMLSNRLNIEMTDPEIRGGIDGFALGSTLTSTLGTFSNLRLSQLLDMYYAPRNGVFNRDLRACNRQALRVQFVNDQVLAAETTAFAAALDSIMPLEGTLIGGLQALVQSSITNFQTYTTNILNDLNCVITETTSPDFRLRTNVYIVLDSSWPYNTIYPAISYLLDTIEVNKFGSSVTLLSAFDGSVLIPQTFSLANFHSLYTATAHQSYMTGVNLETSLSSIHHMMLNNLRNESAINYVGGNSTVLLYLLHSPNIQTNQNVVDQARLLREGVPDTRLVFASSTNQETLANLVRDPQTDIITLTLTATGTNVDMAMSLVLSAIQTVGRKVVNPICGADFATGSSGVRQFDDFVEPSYTNFYRISPNYFYLDNANARVRVSFGAAGIGLGSLTVCHSRTVSLPSQNTTFEVLDTGAITCQNVATSGNVDISLQNACDGFPTIGQCPPLHFSVQSNAPRETSTATCTDVNVCRFPNSIRFQIQVDGLGCFSNATIVIPSVFFVLFGLMFDIVRSL